MPSDSIDAERLMALGMPWGLAEEIIEAILAAGGGSGLSLFVSGITSNRLLGVLPANSWLLRLLIRDINEVGGTIALGTTLGATDILVPQTVTGPYYSLTVDITGFQSGSFANGAIPSIYVTRSGAGSSFSVQLDYELGP